MVPAKMIICSGLALSVCLDDLLCQGHLHRRLHQVQFRALTMILAFLFVKKTLQATLLVTDFNFDFCKTQLRFGSSGTSFSASSSSITSNNCILLFALKLFLGVLGC